MPMPIARGMIILINCPYGSNVVGMTGAVEAIGGSVDMDGELASVGPDRCLENLEFTLRKTVGIRCHQGLRVTGRKAATMRLVRRTRSAETPDSSSLNHPGIGSVVR